MMEIPGGQTEVIRVSTQTQKKVSLILISQISLQARWRLEERKSSVTLNPQGLGITDPKTFNGLG